jgi:hypothetical protein
MHEATPAPADLGPSDSAAWHTFVAVDVNLVEDVGEVLSFVIVLDEGRIACRLSAEADFEFSVRAYEGTAEMLERWIDPLDTTEWSVDRAPPVPQRLHMPVGRPRRACSISMDISQGSRCFRRRLQTRTDCRPAHLYVFLPQTPDIAFYKAPR